MALLIHFLSYEDLANKHESFTWMYVAIIRESLQGGVLDRWREGYGGQTFRIIFGLEKYDLAREKIREKSGNFLWPNCWQPR